MKDELRAHLHDILQAGRAIATFVENRSYRDYQSDELLRSAVERKFMIMGEALNRIQRDEPRLLESIRDHRDIISFRNILAHGYDAIDDQIVWDIIDNDLAGLLDDVEQMLK